MLNLVEAQLAARMENTASIWHRVTFGDREVFYGYVSYFTGWGDLRANRIYRFLRR